jgi:hypothetical protein
LRGESSSGSSDSTTGARSGNSATIRTSPPIAFTVFRNVEINRSLRFSSLETLSWVNSESFGDAGLREFAGLSEITQAHLFGYDLSRAVLDLLALGTALNFAIFSRMFTDMATSFPSLSGQDEHQNGHLPSVSVRGRSAFRSTRFVACNKQNHLAPRVKGESHSPFTVCCTESQFLHVGVA